MSDYKDYTILNLFYAISANQQPAIGGILHTEGDN